MTSLLTNCLSVFDHFVGLVLEGLKLFFKYFVDISNSKATYKLKFLRTVFLAEHVLVAASGM